MRHFITCVLMTINTIPLGFPVRVILRTRLTQGRLTWPWNPWLFGVGVSRQSDYRRYRRVPEDLAYYRRSARDTDFPISLRA